MKITFPFLFILVFSFCAFAQAESVEPKNKFADKAVIYVYSGTAENTLGQVRKQVFLDDLEIADIRPEKYFIIVAEPGEHTIRFKNKKHGGIQMKFEAGGSYYLRIGWQSGLSLRPSGITRVEPESGAYDIKQIKPVDLKNIKEKTIVFTELK